MLKNLDYKKVMKIKKFENFKSDNLIEYPYLKIDIFVEWFELMYSKKMNNEGWAIYLKTTTGKKYVNNFGDVVFVAFDTEENDDLSARCIARKMGLVINDDGVLIGYNNISFLEHPEYLKTFKKKLQQAKDAEKFGL